MREIEFCDKTRALSVRVSAGDQELFSVFIPTNHIYVGDIVMLGPSEILRPNLTVREGLGALPAPRIRCHGRSPDYTLGSRAAAGRRTTTLTITPIVLESWNPRRPFLHSYSFLPLPPPLVTLPISLPAEIVVSCGCALPAHITSLPAPLAGSRNSGYMSGPGAGGGGAGGSGMHGASAAGMYGMSSPPGTSGSDRGMMFGAGGAGGAAGGSSGGAQGKAGSG